MTDRPFHITMLQNEIDKRKEANPRYSLRAFAKFLGLGPSTLSRILSNSQELSLTACRNILKKIKFNNDDCMLFISSIAEEKKRRAYKLLYNIIEDSAEETIFDTYSWMIANTPDLMFIFDRKGRCVHANEPVSQFFNISPELLIGMKMEEIGVHPDVEKKIKTCLAALFKDPKVLKVEECYEVEGSTRCFEITLVPVGHHHDLRAAACHWRDISEKTHLDKLWKISLQVGEHLNSSAELTKCLNHIASHLTEKYCEACIMDFPKSKNTIKSGSPDLLKDFLEFFPLNVKNPTYKELSEEDDVKLISHPSKKKNNLGCILCIPLTNKKKNIGTISLIRSAKRTPFILTDADLARDIKVRIENAMENYLSHPGATL